MSQALGSKKPIDWNTKEMHRRRVSRIMLNFGKIVVAKHQKDKLMLEDQSSDEDMNDA